jgi:hypothetical protein
MKNIRLEDFVSLRLPMVEHKIPFIGRGIELVQQIKFGALMGLILMVASLPSLYSSETKPLLGERSILISPRASQLFYVAPQMAEGYIEAANLITKAQCTKIGLYGFGNDWEYPIWALTKAKDGVNAEIRHITAPLISPAGKPLASIGIQREFEPCSIVSPNTVSENNLIVNGRRYQQVLKTNTIKLFQ